MHVQAVFSPSALCDVIESEREISGTEVPSTCCLHWAAN